MKIRLTEWASQQGISYTTAYRWSKEGKVPGLCQVVSGRLFVEVADPAAGSSVVLYARVANVRRNILHIATTLIAKRYGRCCIEDLKVRNMTRGGGSRKRGLNRVVLDASFAAFREMLKYKGRLYGCEVVTVPPHHTSQRCSACGHAESGNRISQAEFQCLSCGHEVNADLNAALNILVAGSCPDTQNACKSGRSDEPTFGSVRSLQRRQESA